MNRIHLTLILFLIGSVSCTKDDQINNYPADVKFDITGRLFEGKKINAIATDNKGNIWLASDKEIGHYVKSNLKTYSVDYPVIDIAISSDETVWLGTNGGGLAHFDEKEFTWYTSANSGLPRDYVSNVEVANDGKVWFSSCASRLGGLGVYDSKKFSFYTPENSPLNQNVIEDIEIGMDDNVYIATTGTVGKTNIYRISDNAWDCLGNEKGMFYWLMNFSIGPSGSIYLIEDFSLSSTFHSGNSFYKFYNNKWKEVDTDDFPVFGFLNTVKADKRDFCWIGGSDDKGPVLYVYNGSTWQSSQTGMFPEDFITAIETDADNNILVGTYSNGLFILNQ